MNKLNRERETKERRKAARELDELAINKEKEEK